MRHGQSQPLCQLLDGFREGQPIVLNQEAQRRAVGTTDKAVIELLFGADPERRRFLTVKWAAGAVLAAGLLQWHAQADYLDDVGTLNELVDEALRNPAHAGEATGCPRVRQPPSAGGCAGWAAR